jgi:hypothetical protein
MQAKCSVLFQTEKKHTLFLWPIYLNHYKDFVSDFCLIQISNFQSCHGDI